MRTSTASVKTLLCVGALVAAHVPAKAAEYGFSSYALGGSAFGAGVMPPAGTYVTALTGFYSADISGAVQFGDVTVNAGAQVNFFTAGTNILYVPQGKLWGGTLGLSVTVPVGHNDLDAQVSVGNLPGISRDVEGWGLGDITTRAQLGWTQGSFSHIAYIQAVAPTGFWENGFEPIIGLHRPGIDVGWAFTWQHKPTKLQVNGTLGLTFNFENTATDYKTGDEFHFEWAIGQEVSKGLVIGVVGYDYRQITGDSGSGARLGAFMGEVDAVGAGIGYTTLVDKTPLVLNLRHYYEYHSEKRWEGNATTASATWKW